MIDFSYHEEKLSDYGCIVASINTALQSFVQIGSSISFDTVKNNATHTQKIVNTDYDDVISATFDICKNPCLYKTNGDMAFSDGEISHLARWLNQKKYYRFKPIYESGAYSDLYFYGSFTSVSAIVINGSVIGFTLTFTSNSPFGYVDDKEFKASIKTPDDTFLFFDDSDEIGSLYPLFFQVECLASGKLVIGNDRDHRNTVVNNCIQNEIITFDCANRIIQSSKPHPTLYNDFNYSFPRFINSLESRRNVFTLSLPCNITIRYAPRRKAGILV